MDTLQILTDKRATYEHASKLGIRTPATFQLSDHDKIAPEFLPLILKWNETPLGTRVPFKTLIIEDRKSLPGIAKQYEKFSNYLILQQIVVGTDLSYAGYFQNNEELLGCTTEKKRQYPIWGGLGSYVADYVGPSRQECQDSGRKLAETLGVNGFIEVEFKYNALGELYLIEANPRIWGWAKFFKLKCMNFPEFLLDSTIEPIINPNICKWFSLLRDAKSIWAMVKTRRLTTLLPEIVESYKGAKIFDVLERGDLRPFVYQFYKGIRRTR
jgi:predicted ATP-grasp superfamily ATP-dependent carboligase